MVGYVLLLSPTALDMFIRILWMALIEGLLYNRLYSIMTRHRAQKHVLSVFYSVVVPVLHVWGAHPATCSILGRFSYIFELRTPILDLNKGTTRQEA